MTQDSSSCTTTAPWSTSTQRTERKRYAIVTQGEITLNAQCKAAKVNTQDFELTIPGRTYKLTAVEYSADHWVDVLSKEITNIINSGVQREAKSDTRTSGITLDNV